MSECVCAVRHSHILSRFLRRFSGERTAKPRWRNRRKEIPEQPLEPISVRDSAFISQIREIRDKRTYMFLSFVEKQRAPAEG